MLSELINQWKQGTVELIELERKLEEYKNKQIECEKQNGITCPLIKRIKEGE